MSLVFSFSFACLFVWALECGFSCGLHMPCSFPCHNRRMMERLFTINCTTGVPALPPLSQLLA